MFLSNLSNPTLLSDSLCKNLSAIEEMTYKDASILFASEKIFTLTSAVVVSAYAVTERHMQRTRIKHKNFFILIFLRFLCPEFFEKLFHYLYNGVGYIPLSANSWNLATTPGLSSWNVTPNQRDGVERSSHLPVPFLMMLSITKGM